MAEYYASHAHEGRAALGHYSRLEPPSWISRATFRGRVSYWLCKRDHPEIEQLDPEVDVQTLRTQPFRSSRLPVREALCWHVSA